ncbi:MAG: hypothetical protein GY811_23240 [Myxococcales bacterium]|nr:hypothetical protein [Myxococcales bacterium]
MSGDGESAKGMTVESEALVRKLRELIVESAPDPQVAGPILECSIDTPIDSVIPFSSLIVLGTIVAVEHQFDISVSKEAWNQGLKQEPTLRRLAGLIEELRS